MQSLDPRCNALQSVIGMFLHATSTPEKVVKVLSRIGISISVTSTLRAVHSLSEKSYMDIEALGRTFLTSYAYDNFDKLLRTLVPTIDGPPDRGLLHMTSGTLLQLDHGVTVDDLKCARLLWDRSPLNRKATNPCLFDPAATMCLMYRLHPEPDYADGELSRRGRWRSWKFIQDLIKYGPAFFGAYLSELPHPEVVEVIPVTKLHQVPLRAMDIDLSTITGNISALMNMYTQAGVGDPHKSSKQTDEPFADIADMVTIIFGDLGTYEHVLSARRRRAVEHTPYDRLDSVVFGMGLFHVKMAAADTIWRLLVAPETARRDETSFMKIAGRLRPNESSRLISNAKFRQQHELIHHVGAILRLDAWRTEVQKRTRNNTLEEWASSKPSFTDVQAIADSLAGDYVEGEGIDLFVLSTKPAAERDEPRENTIRTHHYLLLYEELSYAMNAGDIGRVENLLASWIPLFRASGKHKYGTQTLRFMHSLYNVYPDGLRSVILQCVI